MVTRAVARQPVQEPVQEPAPARLPAPAPAPIVYPRAIAAALMAIRRDITPIPKEGENTFHKYRYVKAEAVIDEIVPLLTKHGIMITQSEISRTTLDRTLAVTYEYIITNSEGEVWPDRPVRTGMANVQDSKGIADDKASNKASTQSEKYFLIKFFGIRTSDAAQVDGDGDEPPEPPADKPKPEPAPPADPAPPAEEEPPEPPSDEPPDPLAFDGEQWLRDLEGAALGAADLDELQRVQATVQLPARELVSSAHWERGKQLVMDRAIALDEAPADD